MKVAAETARLYERPPEKLVKAHHSFKVLNDLLEGRRITQFFCAGRDRAIELGNFKCHTNVDNSRAMVGVLDIFLSLSCGGRLDFDGNTVSNSRLTPKQPTNKFSYILVYVCI